MTRFQKTFCWLVLLAGLGILALGVQAAYRRYQVVERWPRVAAEITRSRVVFASQDRKARHTAEFSFRFRANGVPYTPSTSVVVSDYREAQELVARHPTGSTRTILYNPRNPAEIELSAGYTPAFFKLPLILGLVSLAFIVVGGLPLWRDSKRLKVDQIMCPNCGRVMDVGRRNCPYCKEELVKY
jgi:hypothetical protein